MSDVTAVGVELDANGVPGDEAAVQTTVETVRYAGFWIRVAASLIDTLILLPIIFLVSFLAQLFSSSGGELVSFLAIWTAIIAYNVLLVTRPAQATWGKQFLGLRIIRVDRKPMGYGLAFGRLLARILSQALMSFGLLMVAFTQEKRGLHDMICKTRVIYK